MGPHLGSSSPLLQTQSAVTDQTSNMVNPMDGKLKALEKIIET